MYALDDVYMAAKEVGDFEGMEAVLRETFDLLPDPKWEWADSMIFAHELIEFLRDPGKAEEALALSDEQFAARPIDDSDPLMYRASTLLVLGRREEASTLFEDVLVRFGKRAFAGHDGGWLVFAETGEVPDGLLELSLIHI